MVNGVWCHDASEALRQISSDPNTESPERVSSENAQLSELHERRSSFIYDENDVTVLFPGKDPIDIKHEHLRFGPIIITLCPSTIG